MKINSINYEIDSQAAFACTALIYHIIFTLLFYCCLFPTIIYFICGLLLHAQPLHLQTVICREIDDPDQQTIFFDDFFFLNFLFQILM